MRRCPNPGCPFRVRHGFAAEFEDSVEGCRSCMGPLEPASDTDPELTGVASSARGPALLRAGTSLVLLLGVVGLAAAPVPGLTVLDRAGIDTAFATLALWPSLMCWIAATLALAWIPAVRARPTSALVHGITLALTLAALATVSWTFQLTLGTLHLRPTPSFPMLLMTAWAGVPVLLGVAYANERWGLGHGPSIVLAGLIVHALTRDPALSGDPIAVVIVLALIAGFAVWLATPTRARSTGRRGPDTELGLGLTVPSCGLIPVLVLSLLRIASAGPMRTLLRYLDVEPGWAPTWAISTELALVVMFAAALAWLFTRPSLLVDRWRRTFPKADKAALADEASGLFRQTLLRSALLLAVVQLLTRQQIHAGAAIILAAVILDLVHEFGQRWIYPDLVALESSLDLPGTASLARGLMLEHRPALVQGLHHRALYRRLGPWLALRILVREGDLARATQLGAEISLARPSRS